MNHDEHRRLQQEILNQVLTILKSSEHVLGCVFAGSYARGEHDAFSDLDIACYLRDEERTGRPELTVTVNAELLFRRLFQTEMENPGWISPDIVMN